MTGDGDERPMDFDTWIAGRSAALTRFAYVLTGSELAAEQALGPALTTACATWARIRRSDDPEAQVQRLVVEAHLWQGGVLRRKRMRILGPAPRATDAAGLDDPARAWRVCATLPPERRAALVLRCYADLTYPQIAGVMEIKQSSAVEHVEQSFESLRLALGRPGKDDELEALFRDAFAEHADDPADPGDRARLAHAGARRRRRRRIVPAVAAAVLLVSGVGAVAVTYDGGGTASAMPKPGEHPRGWRAESYNGIQLWVPSSWGWGQVPRLTRHGMVSCELNAYSPTAVVTGARYLLRGGGALPYVGRPAEPDAGCGAPPISMGSHVWFDSPLRPATGPLQTTVRVKGVTPFNITVADANRAERDMILASIERVAVDAQGCPHDAEAISRVERLAGTEQEPGPVPSLSFCLYATSHQAHTLFYSTRVEGSEAQQATAQVRAGLDAPCLATPAPTRLVLISRSSVETSVYAVSPDRCSGTSVGDAPDPGSHILTAASQRLWALDGLSLYASPAVVGGPALAPFR